MNESYRMISGAKLRTLRRNPQYLTPKQMKSLTASIIRDGFLVPIVVRPMDVENFEIVSGNHRFMAGQEAGMLDFPCVVTTLNEQQAKRVAMNLNTIHGDPPAELIAPFLADLEEDILAEIHLEDDMIDKIKEFDAELFNMLESFTVPEAIDAKSKGGFQKCICKKCGRVHMRLQSKLQDKSIDEGRVSKSKKSI
jgi:ParB/RepB/Spo0J family partition protein